MGALLCILIIAIGMGIGLIGYFGLAGQRIKRDQIKLDIMREETKQMKLANQIVDDFTEQKVEKRLADRKPREWTAKETTQEVERQIREMLAIPSPIVKHWAPDEPPEYVSPEEARLRRYEMEYNMRMLKSEDEVKWW